MTEDEFRAMLSNIEKQFEYTLDDVQRDNLISDIYFDIRPSSDQAMHALKFLRKSIKRFSPTHGQIMDAFTLARKDSAGEPLLAECGTCAKAGFVFMIRDSGYGYDYRVAVPCTCTNAPDWCSHDKNYRQRMDAGQAKLSDFFDVHGRYLHELEDVALDRKREETRQIFEKYAASKNKLFPKGWAKKFLGSQVDRMRERDRLAEPVRVIEAPF